MSLQCGIVGLPNVGKSTLFNALTCAKAEAANYPFCTIDPNVGVVAIPDPRLNQIAELLHPQKVIPTSMEFVDIAGLVAGASEGEGLGNQFLANIRETNAIIHVVRCFEDDNVVHVSGSIDPDRDIEIINTELMLADLSSIEKKVKKVEKIASQDKKNKEEYDLYKKIYDTLKEGQPARSISITSNELELYEHLQLLSAKPTLYICNISENGSEDSPHVNKVKMRAKKENNEVIVLSCGLEAEISQLPPAERSEFLSSLGLKEPALNRLILAAYKLLGLQTFFTAGEKEVRAWTIRKNIKAPQAAGTIHSDFERGFIRAEIYHCLDLFRLKSETAIKEAGLLRLEGKDYVMQDGDVCFFRFNV